MGYRRDESDRNKLEKLYAETKNSCRAGAWFDEKKDRYIKYSASDLHSDTKSLRRATNKRLRKAKFETISDGCAYRKLFDYWWEIW